MVANLGLNSAIDGPIRYKMFTGIDIVEAISESQKGNCYKSNIFGMGYNGNGKTSIGCSYKGTIWGRLVETIDTWKEWCNLNYDKIINPNIHMVCAPSSRQLKKYKIFVLPGWISGNIFMPPIVAFHEIPLVLKLQVLSVAGYLYSNLHIL